MPVTSQTSPDVGADGVSPGRVAVAVVIPVAAPGTVVDFSTTFFDSTGLRDISGSPLRQLIVQAQGAGTETEVQLDGIAAGGTRLAHLDQLVLPVYHTGVAMVLVLTAG